MAKRDLDGGVGGHGGGLDGGYGVGDLDGVGGRDLYRGDPVEESRSKAGRGRELMEFLFIIINVAFILFIVINVAFTIRITYLTP